MLAVTLGHLESAKLLMEKGANVNTENKEGWTGNHSFVISFKFYSWKVILLNGFL